MNQPNPPMTLYTHDVMPAVIDGLEFAVKHAEENP